MSEDGQTECSSLVDRWETVFVQVGGRRVVVIVVVVGGGGVGGVVGVKGGGSEVEEEVGVTKGTYLGTGTCTKYPCTSN